ncbi:MAG TPA: GNAT family N-acetyltransferase [Jatrophihabitantaceae bacterium]|nr:GNAT family N-acetyltransferase [Jatrophihabitantaceae bacterium]
MAQFRGVELTGLEIPSERLLLRPWRGADAPTVAAIMQSGALHEYARSLPDPYTAEDAWRFVNEVAPAAAQAGTGLERAVVQQPSGRLVGAVALRLPQGSSPASIGYWIDPAAQRGGLATEATRTMAAWGLAHGVDRIEITCDVRNVASAKVALRAGFSFEGLRRDDHGVFARLAADSGEPIEPTFTPLAGDGLGDETMLLRVPCMNDLAAFAEQEEDEHTIAVGFLGRAKPRAAMAALLARASLEWLVGPTAQFTMVDVATGRFAGSLHLRGSGPPNVAGIGYAVHPDFRGRGYTTRALRLVADWAFSQAGFVRLELGARQHNIASQRAAAAAGFVPDGVAASRLRNADGTFSDEVRYALVNPDYR